MGRASVWWQLPGACCSLRTVRVPLRTLRGPLQTLRVPLRTLCASVKRAGSAECAVACMGRTAGSREGNAGPQGLLADTLWRSLELLVVTSQTGAVRRWPVSRAC